MNTKCVDLDGDGTPDADADVNNDGEIDVNEAFILENLDVSAANIHTWIAFTYLRILKN
ncbi:MAG: hypothetical protein IPP49_16065 [Saprospiraceae bacterium]|nr:hypothetical protein [Saprospiraceae bacterium]